MRAAGQTGPPAGSTGVRRDAGRAADSILFLAGHEESVCCFMTEYKGLSCSVCCCSFLSGRCPSSPVEASSPYACGKRRQARMAGKPLPPGSDWSYYFEGRHRRL